VAPKLKTIHNRNERIKANTYVAAWFKVFRRRWLRKSPNSHCYESLMVNDTGHMFISNETEHYATVASLRTWRVE
jgi:hypothetical protein